MIVLPIGKAFTALVLEQLTMGHGRAILIGNLIFD
jgi:hypothetical protein